MAGVLRAIASDDEATADSAFETLTGWISHQGSIYQTTTACVPFLVELTQIAHFHRADLIWEVGYVADPDRTGGPEHVNIRAAVARSVDRIATLIDDKDPVVRAHAAYTLVQCGGTGRAEVLWQRWQVEDDPDVRAALHIALGQRDTDNAVEALSSAMLTGSPRERLAAAVAISRADLDRRSG